MVGPTLQQDLVSIVMRFRTHRVAITADVEKMYRQVWVHGEDTPLQRILWRKDPTHPISTYELQTVTYGTASAPYLATRTLVQIGKDQRETYPLAAAAILNDFYIDDFISGAETCEEAISLRQQVSGILQAAGFPLRKWVSNNMEVIKDIPDADLGIKQLHDDKEEQYITTLGLIWDPKADTLSDSTFNFQRRPRFSPGESSYHILHRSTIRWAWWVR